VELFCISSEPLGEMIKYDPEFCAIHKKEHNLYIQQFGEELRTLQPIKRRS